ncbi:MAG: lactate dehydrogenase [Polyangiales bacterium]
MDISIIGASGTVGRQIAIGLARSGLVPTNARLQLVGRRGGASEQSLPGIAVDLADALAEDLPEIDLAFTPKDVVGDIIILVAGDAVGRGDKRSRAELAVNNRPVVEAYARAIAESGHGEELLLVLTNPVEACVAWCTRYIDRRRVIGMGAYLDTLRFRQEIAHDLGVRRQRVQGLVLGEHGPRMVPCWSTVDVLGFDSEEGRARLAALRRPRDPSVAEAVRIVVDVAEKRGARAAYARADRFGPGLRVAVKPSVTQLCGARSPASTAEMILRLLSTLLSGGQVLTAAQVALEGEFLGMHGVTGAPIVMTLNGVDRVLSYDLPADERAQVRASLYVDEEAGRRTSRRASAEPDAPQPTERFRFVLRIASGALPGTVERVSAVFAGRGINLESVQTASSPHPTLTLRFRATARVKDYLTRRLSRIRDVVRVEAARAG